MTIACSGVGYIRLHTARCACVRLCMHTAPFRFTVLPRSDTRERHKEHVHSPLNQITRLVWISTGIYIGIHESCYAYGLLVMSSSRGMAANAVVLCNWCVFETNR